MFDCNQNYTSIAVFGHTEPGPHARARTEQQAAWQKGKAKTVEQLLVEFPEVVTDRAAIMELIYMEILHRDSKRESPTLAEYRQRFPALAEQLACLFPDSIRQMPNQGVDARQDR